MPLLSLESHIIFLLSVFIFLQTRKLVLLVNVQLEHREENDCIFTIIDTNNKNKKLVFKAFSAEECKKWLETLFEAILECKQNAQHQDRSEACSIQ